MSSNRMELVARGAWLELRLSYASLCVRRRVPCGSGLVEALRGVLSYARFCIDRDTVVVTDEAVADALRELRQDEAYWAEYRRQVQANAVRLQPAYQEGDEWNFSADSNVLARPGVRKDIQSSDAKEYAEK